MKCIYCGILVIENVPNTNFQQVNYDHIDINGGTIRNNMVLACRKCNSSKGDKNIFSWCRKQKINPPETILKLIRDEQMTLKVIEPKIINEETT